MDMAPSNKNTGQERGRDPGIPSTGNYDYLQAQQASGREYAKEFLAWAGKWLRIAGKRVYTQLVKSITIIPRRQFNGVDTKALDKRMRKINWNKDYYSDDAIAMSMQSRRLQRDIVRVNSIFRDLKRLSDSGHHLGEELRWKLQRKYWSDTRMHAQTGNTREVVVISPGKLHLAKNDAAELKQSKGNLMEIKPIIGSAVSVSQTLQENEARRLRIAKAGASLLTSLVGKENKRKKGLGL